jgi:hypothetical protein
MHLACVPPLGRGATAPKIPTSAKASAGRSVRSGVVWSNAFPSGTGYISAEADANSQRFLSSVKITK